MTSQTLGRSFFIQDWIRTGVEVNRAPVEPESHTLRERVEREASNPIAATTQEAREIGLFSYLEFDQESRFLHSFGVLTTN